MIVTCVSHGRTTRDALNLARHLAKSDHQNVQIVASYGLTPGLSLTPALDDLRAFSGLSMRARIGFHHLTVNPARPWTDAQRDGAVNRILTELGARDHARILVEHSAKARAMPGGASTHFHLAVAHVGADGKALDMRWSYARLESVARSCEMDFGEPLTPSRRPAAVIERLRGAGREDVARRLERAPVADTAPRSAMTSAGRARASRRGLDLPACRAAVRQAWDSPSLLAVLESVGLRIAAGDRTKAPVVKTADGEFVGALDRMARVTRAEALARLEAEMAKPKNTKGDKHEQSKSERRDPNAGPARQGRVARRRGDQGRGELDSGPVDANRGLPSPRLAGPNRSNARNPADAPAAAHRRRRRALAELRRADAAAQQRAKGGRSSADDMQAAKAALWCRLFGADLSPQLVAALHYVDVQERVVRLTSGGWVRDEGDTIYASGADPVVVAVMVHAAKSKGWPSVKVWGSEAFIDEARKQFGAAGIPVTVGEAPPPAAIERPDDPALRQRDELAARLADEFRRRRDEAEAAMEKLQRPAETLEELRLAMAKEDALDAAWRAAFRDRTKARAARAAAAAALEEAGFLSRGKARRAAEAARQAVSDAQDALDTAVESHEAARDRASDLKRSHEKAERNRLAENASAAAQARRSKVFAEACLAEVQALPDLAWKGRQAVEQAAMQRLAEEAAEREKTQRLAAGDDQRSGFTGP